MAKGPTQVQVRVGSPIIWRSNQIDRIDQVFFFFALAFVVVDGRGRFVGAPGAFFVVAVTFDVVFLADRTTIVSVFGVFVIAFFSTARLLLLSF
jgi:hypothetical protein